MLTVLELIQKTSTFLAGKGIPSPRLDAEWMLAHLLQCGRMQLYLQFERPLDEKSVTRYREMVRRRGKREPLQYILGETPFGECLLQCDPRALIPRPETEELAERLTKRIRTSAPLANGPFLDLGTGTGAIALLLGKWFPETAIHGLDQSPESLELARQNARKNFPENAETRFHWHQSNWYEKLPSHLRFAAIVANPPYLTKEEWASAEPEVNQYEPFSALVAEDDGEADLRTIIAGAGQFLLPGGWLALETGIQHPDRLSTLFDRSQWTAVETEKDFQQRPRYLFARIAG